MFLLDDLVLFPLKGITALCESVRDQVDSAREDEDRSLRDRLTTLYMELETGRITEAEFDRAEEEILDRLGAAGSTDDRGPAHGDLDAGRNRKET